jgi:ApaG protein
MAKNPSASNTVTEGVRVIVTPFYMPVESAPEHNKFIFGYRIVIRNEGEATVQLLSRHWIIIDADGEKHEVKGEGVVGHTPVLESGQEFQYTSHVPLETAWGTMEGAYQMIREDGWMFDAVVGRFYLSAREMRDVPAVAAQR